MSSYDGNHLVDNIKIWEACSATLVASSLFDPIIIGQNNEKFVGAIGANNPVWEVWNHAQLTWGPEPIESKVKCLFSIGTGVPSYKNDMRHLREALSAIAISSERRAEHFQQDKLQFDKNGQYYRFNMTAGLENVGLDDSSNKERIEAATWYYIKSRIFIEMQICADKLAGRACGKESTQDSLADLAPKSTSQEQWKEAEVVDLQLYEKSKMMLGMEHPDTLTSMANLASVYMNQSR